ncbi:hypothetical protein CCHL11_00873 [Colletotrichum chlorophyti]|uniref:Uncharacterized protein n=1 Tax=Colletotrichum chlorophyti TaxID=708187 RepID=A0A1Q8S5E8_9PEZI|nr:hypothetical protein CCHL11_00873 [Colletotrichum chlorophyti]
MSSKSGAGGSLGNSSNPRPGQSPFPTSNAALRRSPDPQPSKPYTSSYINNFDRTSARYSTGLPDPSRPWASRRQRGGGPEQGNESIYGMYGDIKTPRSPRPPPPPPRRSQQLQEQRRRSQRVPDDNDENDSFDEEVPRRHEPQPRQGRYSRQRQGRGEGQGEEELGRNQRSRRAEEHQEERQQGRPGDAGRRRVNVNIDVGGNGARSWSWTTDSRGPNLVNFDAGPFRGTGMPFLGRDAGGRLPVNLPLGGGLPINLPFGL